MYQEVIMKRRKIAGVCGILLILALLFSTLLVLPVYAATYDITLSPNQGKIGDTITVNGDFSATSTERFATIYFSPSNLATNTLITSAPSYKQVGTAIVPDTINNPDNAGEFTKTFVVPSTLPIGYTDYEGGTVEHTVSTGTYYIYTTVSTGGSSSLTIVAKATLTIVSAALGTLSPTSGPPGTQVTITGSNFPASAALIFTFDTATTLTPTGDTNVQSTGVFISTVTIPSTATVGTHIITVTAGTTSASAYFAVTGGQTTTPPTTTPPTTATISLDPTSGSTSSNTSISISGSGFIANYTITITYDADNEFIKETLSNESGAFLTSFAVPDFQHGTHIIYASDGTNTASATFTTESDSPSTPQPVRPYMNEAVSLPLTLDWADVTDISMPITYDLQISTSNFSGDYTITINKTGITASQYTLTAAEEANLHSGITYYWRVKAVDAALNESAWTGTNIFTVATPFSFIGWPLYTTFGIVALFLFLLGIYLGRKTAFNY
jgi:hypothetical protein